MRIVKEAFEFEWDKENIDKNKKHVVKNKESEETFFDKDRFIFKDHIHSGKEERFQILGKTREDRLLFVVFTKRGKKIGLFQQEILIIKKGGVILKKIKASKV